MLLSEVIVCFGSRGEMEIHRTVKVLSVGRRLNAVGSGGAWLVEVESETI